MSRNRHTPLIGGDSLPYRLLDEVAARPPATSWAVASEAPDGICEHRPAAVSPRIVSDVFCPGRVWPAELHEFGYATNSPAEADGEGPPRGGASLEMLSLSAACNCLDCAPCLFNALPRIAAGVASELNSLQIDT